MTCGDTREDYTCLCDGGEGSCVGARYSDICWCGCGSSEAVVSNNNSGLWWWWYRLLSQVNYRP